MRRSRGIVLVISIVLAVVMIMFVGAAIGLGPANLVAGQNTVYRDQAERAAESGVQYALAQLQKDPTWRGALNTVTVNSPDLYVVEDNGNVIGLLTAPDGSRSQFRLRFNYKDGSGGADGLEDSAQDVDIPYVSLNNLTGGGEAQVPRADGPGYSVTPTSATPHTVPIWACSLAVEGRAGKGMEQASPANPNPAVVGGATRVVVEGIYQVPDLGPGMQETALMAAGGFKSHLKSALEKKVELSTKSGDQTAKLRSKGLVEVTGGDPTANFGGKEDGDVEVYSGDGALTAAYNATKVKVAQEADLDPFYQLVWNDVKKPAPDADKLKAGTYVWWQDGTLHYYDMSYSDYVTAIKADPSNPGVAPAPLPASVQVDTTKKKKLILTASLAIEGTTKTSDLSLVLREGAAEVPPDKPVKGGGGIVAIPAGGVTDALVDQISTNILSQGRLKEFLMSTQSSDGRIEMWDPKGQHIGMISWNPDGQGTIAVSTSGETNILLNQLMLPGMFPTSQQTLTNLKPVDVLAVAQQYGVDEGKTPGELDLPGVDDTLTASDVEISFAGKDQGVVLYGEGDIRLTGGVRGKGGSIVAGGDLRITGMGAEFASLAVGNNADGVNMYAKGDIVFNTLDKKDAGKYEYQDVKLKGIVYAWGDFIANLGAEGSSAGWGTLSIEGALIAYGGDPAGKPGANLGKGRVQIEAGQVRLTFDPSYAGALSQTLPAGFKLKTLSWSNNLP